MLALRTHNNRYSRISDSHSLAEIQRPKTCHPMDQYDLRSRTGRTQVMKIWECRSGTLVGTTPCYKKDESLADRTKEDEGLLWRTPRSVLTDDFIR